MRSLLLNARSVLLLTSYTITGVALEELATLFETAEKITPWDPSSSLHFVLLLGFGLRYTPALLLIPLVDNFVIRPSDIAPSYLLLAALCVTLWYGAAKALLLYQLRIDPRLYHFRDVFWFAVVAAFVTPLFVAVSVVTTLAAAGEFSWSIYRPLTSRAAELLLATTPQW